METTERVEGNGNGAAPARPPFGWVKGRRGDWLVRGPKGCEGETVPVTKKSGEVKKVALDRCLWEGEEDVALYTVYRPYRARGGYYAARRRYHAPVVTEGA